MYNIWSTYLKFLFWLQQQTHPKVSEKKWATGLRSLNTLSRCDLTILFKGNLNLPKISISWNVDNRYWIEWQDHLISDFIFCTERFLVFEVSQRCEIVRRI